LANYGSFSTKIPPNPGRPVTLVKAGACVAGFAVNCAGVKLKTLSVFAGESPFFSKKHRFRGFWGDFP
jgi:hypothetical protein